MGQGRQRESGWQLADRGGANGRKDEGRKEDGRGGEKGGREGMSGQKKGKKGRGARKRGRAEMDGCKAQRLSVAQDAQGRDKQKERLCVEEEKTILAKLPVGRAEGSLERSGARPPGSPGRQDACIHRCTPAILMRKVPGAVSLVHTGAGG